MTEQHECEWGPWHPWCSTYRCIHPGCHKNMPAEEVARRLNEPETQKAENEAWAVEYKRLAEKQADAHDSPLENWREFVPEEMARRVDDLLTVDGALDFERIDK